MTKICTSLPALFVAITLLVYGFVAVPVFAEGHGAEESHEEGVMDDHAKDDMVDTHENEHEHEDEGMEHSEIHTIALRDAVDDATRLEKMEMLLQLLMQLVELLGHQMEHQGMSATTQIETFKVTVEEHGGVTHIHVYEDGKQTDAFFLEELALDQESAIIAAVAERIDYSEAEIEAVIIFPTATTDEMHDDHENHDVHADEGLNLDGIHIMGDGSVMFGNGESVAGAIVTDDGMILLADGTLVEPEMDLR